MEVSDGCNVFHASTKDGRKRDTENFDHNEAMSMLGQHFVEGILTHLPSVMALTIPTTNSFRRVGHGCWTGSDALWAIDDKNAPIRIVIDHQNSSSTTRLEYKTSDSTANIYLSLSAILMAGFDGITNKSTLRNPLSNKKHGGDVEGRSITTHDNREFRFVRGE